MQVATFTIVEIGEEGQPSTVFVSGELPVTRAMTLLQNFAITAAKAQGRAEAAREQDKPRQRKTVTSEGMSKKQDNKIKKEGKK